MTLNPSHFDHNSRHRAYKTVKLAWTDTIIKDPTITEAIDTFTPFFKPLSSPISTNAHY